MLQNALELVLLVVMIDVREGRGVFLASDWPMRRHPKAIERCLLEVCGGPEPNVIGRGAQVKSQI
jgi:hypothetical protein